MADPGGGGSSEDDDKVFLRVDRLAQAVETARQRAQAEAKGTDSGGPDAGQTRPSEDGAEASTPPPERPTARDARQDLDPPLRRERDTADGSTGAGSDPADTPASGDDLAGSWAALSADGLAAPSDAPAAAQDRETPEATRDAGPPYGPPSFPSDYTAEPVARGRADPTAVPPAPEPEAPAQPAFPVPRRKPAEPAEPLVLRDPVLPAAQAKAAAQTPALQTERDATSSPSGPVLLSVRGLHADEARAHALKDLDLDIPKEGVTAICGPAGAGKSALLRTLSGRTRATAGSVRIAGEDIAGWPSDAVARHGIGYLPPTGGAFASLTVVENLRLSGRGSAQARDRRVWLMRAFPDLADAATRKASRLPRRLARLVAVARVLVAPRRLYLLDRPFADLPSGADTTLAGVLRDLRLQGATIVLTAAQPDAALEVASHAALMADGSVRWSGDAEAFMAEPTLARAAFGRWEAGT